MILLVASYSVNWIHSSTCHAFDLFDALLRQAQLLVPQLEICALAGCVSRGLLTSGIRKSTRTVLLSRGSTDTAQTLACPCTVPGKQRHGTEDNGVTVTGYWNKTRIVAVHIFPRLGEKRNLGSPE